MNDSLHDIVLIICLGISVGCLPSPEPPLATASLGRRATLGAPPFQEPWPEVVAVRCRPLAQQMPHTGFDSGNRDPVIMGGASRKGIRV